MNEHNYKTWSGSLAKENIKLKKMLVLSWVYILISHIGFAVLGYITR